MTPHAPSAAPDSTSTPAPRLVLLLALGLAALAFAPYAQVVGFEFVACDDPEYVYENPVVLRGLTSDGVRWAFGSAHVANWHPLTWLSHMLDCGWFVASDTATGTAQPAANGPAAITSSTPRSTRQRPSCYSSP
jgi:hypothetical protein